MPGWIGPWEIAILLVIVLLVFGPKRLPEMGRSLGKGMREFKDAVTGVEETPTASSAPGELPSASSEPAPPRSEAEAAETKRETVH